MNNLYEGETEATSNGAARCAVCYELIAPGPAVKISPYPGRLRHVGCVPKKRLRRLKGVVPLADRHTRYDRTKGHGSTDG